MGKLFDYCMTGNWEETQRIDLYKKLGRAIETQQLSEDKIQEIQEILEENKKRRKINGKKE